jgi:hypothetical protein
MGDALARRADMSVNAYSFPSTFVQQKQLIPLTGATLEPQSVVLTGFRAGEVRAIDIWLTRTSDTSSTTTGYNPFRWRLPTSVQMSYSGDIYARYENGSSALWNLINGDKQNAVNNTVISGAGGAITIASELAQWVRLPFAQTLVDEDSHYTLVHGKAITNGIVNIDISTPTADADYIMNVSYIYNTTLLFSQGTVDYIF